MSPGQYPHLKKLIRGLSSFSFQCHHRLLLQPQGSRISPEASHHATAWNHELHWSSCCSCSVPLLSLRSCACLYHFSSIIHGTSRLICYILHHVERERDLESSMSSTSNLSQLGSTMRATSHSTSLVGQTHQERLRSNNNLKDVTGLTGTSFASIAIPRYRIMPEKPHGLRGLVDWICHWERNKVEHTPMLVCCKLRGGIQV